MRASWFLFLSLAVILPCTYGLECGPLVYEMELQDLNNNGLADPGEFIEMEVSIYDVADCEEYNTLYMEAYDYEDDSPCYVALRSLRGSNVPVEGLIDRSAFYSGDYLYGQWEVPDVSSTDCSGKTVYAAHGRLCKVDPTEDSCGLPAKCTLCYNSYSDPNTHPNLLGSFTFSGSGPNSVDGQCGSSPDTCLAGDFEDDSDTETHIVWQCMGQNGGATDFCSAPRPSTSCCVDGDCCGTCSPKCAYVTERYGDGFVYDLYDIGGMWMGEGTVGEGDDEAATAALNEIQNHCQGVCLSYGGYSTCSYLYDPGIIIGDPAIPGGINEPYDDEQHIVYYCGGSSPSGDCGDGSDPQTDRVWTQDGGSSHITTVTPEGWLSARLVETFSDDIIKVYVDDELVYEEPTPSSDPSNHNTVIDVPLDFVNGVPFTIKTVGECLYPCQKPNAAVAYEYTHCDGSHSSTECGNGVVEAGEDCDEGENNGGDLCPDDCEYTSTCGNGNIESWEECDDGDTDGTDYCTTECQFNICGDGFMWLGIEQCDDGNHLPFDGCGPYCIAEAPCSAYTDWVTANASRDNCDPTLPATSINNTCVRDNDTDGIYDMQCNQSSGVAFKTVPLCSSFEWGGSDRYEWSTTAWSECSAEPYWGSWGSCPVACGSGQKTRTCYGTGGTQSRTVTCKDALTGQPALKESLCTDPKPASQQACTEDCSGSSTQSCSVPGSCQWVIGSWSSCSANAYWGSWGACNGKCGTGTQYRTCYGTSGSHTRSVVCKNSLTGAVAPNRLCPSPKPASSKSCSDSCSGASSRNCNTGKPCEYIHSVAGDQNWCDGYGTLAVKPKKSGSKRIQCNSGYKYVSGSGGYRGSNVLRCSGRASGTRSYYVSCSNPNQHKCYDIDRIWMTCRIA
jgi:cysteine-rich repeat protein